jgi:DNA-binding NarL/FixJ family response regulator
VTTVLLVDDEPLVRLGFSMVLAAHEDLQVVGEAGNGAEAVVMDVRMPVLDGVAATRRIVSAGVPSRVVVLTTFDLDEYAFAALQAGASGFLLKNTEPAELVAAIRTVARGDAVVAPRVTRRLLETFAAQLPSADRAADPRLARLTDREREVLVQVATGRSNAEIAAELTLSELTVKTHVGRILTKLELRDRTQAAVLAYRERLVVPP